MSITSDTRRRLKLRRRRRRRKGRRSGHCGNQSNEFGKSARKDKDKTRIDDEDCGTRWESERFQFEESKWNETKSS
jgi:hypothetical protein